VEDSGPGIAKEDKGRIFEAFTQTKNGHDKKEGTGLGLTISRQFARRLGGDIKVSGVVDQGAVFEFTVLVKPATVVEVESHETASFQKSSSCGLSAEAFKAAIGRLPKGALNELKTAIELSDMDRIAHVIAEIGASHGALANGLTELVDTFQFDRLLAFLEGTDNASSENQGEQE
jgi:hypothetical protein